MSLPHTGFNPGLARHHGRLVFAWREGYWPGSIYVSELDERWSLRATTPVRLLLRGRDPSDSFEDPRLFHFGSRLWLAFTWVKNRRVHQALASLTNDLRIDECHLIDAPVGSEKNWQFFEHEDDLWVVYHPQPHTVGRIGAGRMELLFQSSEALSWEWGEPRGGTPPIRLGDEYFSFFHSSRHNRYVAAAYAFEAQPPFRITRWPKRPCIIPGQDVWRCGRSHVVFPGGAIYEAGHWTLAYGWHDTYCCLTRLDHASLLDTLETAQVKNSSVPREAISVGRSRFLVVITVAKEPAQQIEWCLHRLRAAHPEIGLIVLADGEPDSAVPVLAEEYQGRFVPGQKLRSLAHGARWWERFFREALAEPVDFILKIDPDTQFWRPLRYFPKADFFGTVRDARSANEHVQAGCMGFSRCFAVHVLESGIALDPRYTDRGTWSLGDASEEWMRARGEDYLSLDCIALHFAKTLGFGWSDWPEVHSFCGPGPKNAALRYAVTHAHKNQRLAESWRTGFALTPVLPSADGPRFRVPSSIPARAVS